MEKRRVQYRGQTPVLLTIIVPVYNEESTIDEILRQMLRTPYDKQVVVVDDGSIDDTKAILESWHGHRDVELVRHSMNCGKGAAIRTGLARARGVYTIIQDADLEYSPDDYRLLMEPLLSGDADVVYGSRYLSSADNFEWRRLFRWGVCMLNTCVRILYGVTLTDEATCYKAFPTHFLRAMDLKCDRFEFCPEVTAKACRMGLTIREVPIRYCARTAQQGKKIRLRDGWEALLSLWKWRHWRAPVVHQNDKRISSSGSRRPIALERVDTEQRL